MKKILFVSKKRIDHYGVAFGLVNSSKFCSEFLSQNLNIESNAVLVIDANGIDKEIHKYKPNIVVLEAIWVTPHKIKELLKLHKKITWIIRIHSKSSFLATEGIAFSWLNSYKEISQEYRNFHIAVNNEQFHVDLSSIMHTNILYLPNLYPLKKQDQSVIFTEFDFNTINIGCFGALRPLKNQVQQAIAAIIFANNNNLKLKFHINSNRIEQKGEEVLKNLRAIFKGSYNHRLIEHNWTDHVDFYKIVKSMDIGMQVSMTESFNIVTADFVANKIPIVVSKDIDWVPFIWRCDPTDTNEIVNKLELAWAFGGTTLNLIALHWYNIKSLKVWEKFISNF